MYRSATAIRFASLLARKNAHRTFSSAAAGGKSNVIKQTFSKETSMGIALSGIAILLLAGSGGSSSSKAQEQQQHSTAVADEQTLAIISQISNRLDRLETLLQEYKKQALESKAKAEIAEEKRQKAEAELAKVNSASEKQAVIQKAGETNRAFVFIKPHANTEQVDLLVKSTLAEKGITIKSEGTLTAEEIDSKKLIDNHYGAIASKAVLQKPNELNVPEKGKVQFKETFGLTWEDAVAQNKVLNAADACVKLNVDGDALEGLWRKIDKKDLIKFGGGFYCGQVEPDLYVINGFYMQMRGKYTTPPSSIHYYEVEWNPSTMSWKQFRENFLGATDPTKAAEGSLRRRIYENWQGLGLKEVPNTGDNGMHGSASPFEALAEVCNWEGKKLDEDLFGKALLLASGLDQGTLKLWLSDAQVPVDGKPTSIFDTLEDQDSKENLEKIQEIVSKLPAKIVA
jgi:nucleoside diphosphate kinase